MTIKDLFQYLRKMDSEIEISYPMTIFYGRRIAVDASDMLHRYFSISWKETLKSKMDSYGNLPQESLAIHQWLSFILNYALMLMRFGVTPVFVFEDGTNPIKQDKKKERRDSKESSRVKVGELTSIPLEKRTQEDVNELRKLYQRITLPIEDDVFSVREFLSNLGFPVLLTSGEAEKLCTSLCIEGRVEAVWSVDQDNMAYGCPLQIIGKDIDTWEEGKKVSQVVTISLGDVLRILDWDYDTFVDYCIMLGCDYNKRIRGIGPAKAHKLMDEFGSIDEISSMMDVSCLNHAKCRREFSCTPSRKLIKKGPKTLNVNMETFEEKGRDILECNGLIDKLEALTDAFNNLPKPSKSRLRPPRNPFIDEI